VAWADFGQSDELFGLDTALVNDERVSHGVTPVEATRPNIAGHRDILVITFRRKKVSELANHSAF